MQKTSDTKFADYKPHVAFFFPGQGAQTVGMAKVNCGLLFAMVLSCTRLKSKFA
jgi:acyl transferase domain-containing protein